MSAPCPAAVNEPLTNVWCILCEYQIDVVQCRMVLFKVKSGLEDGVDTEDAKAAARTRVRCLEEEIKLLETDLRMLREYIESNRCIDENGKEHVAVHETAFTDLNCQVRPRATA